MTNYMIKCFRNEPSNGPSAPKENNKNIRGWCFNKFYFSWLGPELLVCCLVHRGSTGVFLLL